MDNSINTINPHFDDCYFSEESGLLESLYVFVDGNHLPSVLETREQFSIGETGFGTGLNLLALVSSIIDSSVRNKKIIIDFYTVEKFPLPSSRCLELLSPFESGLKPILQNYLDWWEFLYITLKPGWNEKIWEIEALTINFHLYFGDVLDMLKTVPANCDCWFLDGHSPDKNPGMWSPVVMKLIGDKSTHGTTLATFTAAGQVKRALREAGFTVKRRKGYGKKRHMIQGCYNNN